MVEDDHSGLEAADSNLVVRKAGNADDGNMAGEQDADVSPDVSRILPTSVCFRADVWVHSWK